MSNITEPTETTESQLSSEKSIVDAELFDAICSEEFQTLIRVDALNGIRKFHPVYVLGYDAAMLKVMRSSYCSDAAALAVGTSKRDTYKVGIYNVPSIDSLAKRVGIAPSVMVLAPEVELAGAVHLFVKQNHIPVLRVLHKHSTLVQLPNTDYYGGVYKTVVEDDIAIASIWTRAINIGLLVWLRTRGFRTDDNTVVSLRGTHAIRRSALPKPEPTFSQFVHKQLERLGFDVESEASLTHIAASSDSSFDFSCNDNSASAKRQQTHEHTYARAKVFPMHNIVQPNY